MQFLTEQDTVAPQQNLASLGTKEAKCNYNLNEEKIVIFRNFINLGLLSITVFLTSCSSTSYQIPGAKNPEVFLKPLERDEYEVLGDVEKRGCASKYWIISLIVKYSKSP